MGDEKHLIIREDPPIPSYEEALASSSRLSSYLGNRGSSDTSERQRLVLNESFDPPDQQHQSGENYEGPGSSNYHPPRVDSTRGSLDSLISSNVSREGDGERHGREGDDLRTDLEQMDMEDPLYSTSSSSSPSRLSKRLSQFQQTLKSLSFSRFIPRFIPRSNIKSKIKSVFSAVSSRLEGQKCMVALRVFALIIVVTIVYLLFASDVFNFGKINWGQVYEPESVRKFVEAHVNDTAIAHNLDLLTRYPHMAGTEGSYVLAQLVENRFEEAHLEDVKMERYDVYLNYPKAKGRRVAIVHPTDLAWEAIIDEDSIPGTTTNAKPPLSFFGHSKAGNVTGPMVYANYGSREDFQKLADLKIQSKGSIALIRYSGPQDNPGLKVKAAEMAGAIGCILYSDPADNGPADGEPYPKGRYMSKDGVQRGSMSLSSWLIGDVLSPGWASLTGDKHRDRVSKSHGLVNIPSLPLSWSAAQHLMQVLKGHGVMAPKEWAGAMPDVEWWTGNDQSPKINLVNLQNEVERQPIYNVLGRIEGLEDPEKKIIIGSHRDSWCYGAVDPGSGQSILLEVVRVLGELRAQNWRPLRTIEVASWDGGQYNMIGSTEHCEEHFKDLRKNSVAYVNVDAGIWGDKLSISGNPMFKTALRNVLKRLGDPGKGKSLLDTWAKDNYEISPLGADGDYAAFQDIAGTASLNLAFTGDKYPRDSCYETYDWMSRFGDPGFRYHKALTKMWLLLVLELADSRLLPYDLNAYSSQVSHYVDDLESYAKSKGASSPFDLHPLRKAANAFHGQATKMMEWSAAWNDSLGSSEGFETSMIAVKRRAHNAQLAYLDTRLLDLDEGGGVCQSPPSCSYYFLVDTC